MQATVHPPQDLMLQVQTRYATEGYGGEVNNCPNSMEDQNFCCDEQKLQGQQNK